MELVNGQDYICEEGRKCELRKELEVKQVLHVRKIMLEPNDVIPPRKRKLQQLTKSDISEDSRMTLKRKDHRSPKNAKGSIDVSSPVSRGHELKGQTTQSLDDISRQKFRDRQTCYEVRQPIVKVPSLGKVFSSESIEMTMNWDSTIYKVPRQSYIPIGPRFQVDIPEWTGSMKSDGYCSSVDNAGDLRWLGTRVWPMEGKTTNVLFKDIGRGRDDNCSCLSPGSIECVNQHVLEQRVKLQSELGSAFRSWRIDEMGEAITKSWMTKEKRSFNSLVEKSMHSKGVHFWNVASKCFPGKSDKHLQHYFLNVYIPRRNGLQTRLSLEGIDTDDGEDDDDMDNPESKAVFNGEGRGVKKSRYLHGRR